MAKKKGPELCPTCGQTVAGGLPVMVDLHQLVRREGLDRVAEVAGVSTGAMRNMRSGFRPTKLGHLYRIKLAFGDFDLLATIMRLGPKRLERMTNGKASEPQGSEGEGEGSTGSAEVEPVRSAGAA